MAIPFAMSRVPKTAQQKLLRQAQGAGSGYQRTAEEQLPWAVRIPVRKRRPRSCKLCTGAGCGRHGDRQFRPYAADETLQGHRWLSAPCEVGHQIGMPGPQRPVDVQPNVHRSVRSRPTAQSWPDPVQPSATRTIAASAQPARTDTGRNLKRNAARSAVAMKTCCMRVERCFGPVLRGRLRLWLLTCWNPAQFGPFC